MSMTLQAALWRLKLTPTDRVLLGALCDASDDNGTGCFTSESYLIWKTQLSRSVIYQRMAALEAAGVIERKPLSDGRIEKVLHLSRLEQKPEYERPTRGRKRKTDEATDHETLTPRKPRKRPTPPAAPDTTSWPASSDIDHTQPADPAGELAGPDPEPEPVADEPSDQAEAIRRADAVCRMEALEWSRKRGMAYAGRAERQRAYAKAQGYADWEQYLAVYVRTHGQRIEAAV